ncbi:hypothetical protein [Bacillus xiapuensis]|uniref:Heterocycloanthracin/sonorensin family bacteriocin n=1 Tax=Bacillus xiapuensis TaxID=2014075 RepID=A0ABU6NDL0_9BACI|nr:hypothetical protein [Bacillus xiapuensis]
MQNFQHELHMLGLDNYQVREVIPIGPHNSRLFGGFGCGGFRCGGFGCVGFGCVGCFGCFGFGCFGLGFGFI